MGDIGKVVGDKLRELRTKRGRTLRQVGEAIGIDYSYLGRIEKGKFPSMALLEQLAEYYKIDVSELFGDQVEVPEELREIGVEWITFAKEMQKAELTPEEIKHYIKLVQGIEIAQKNKKNI